MLDYRLSLPNNYSYQLDYTSDEIYEADIIIIKKITPDFIFISTKFTINLNEYTMDSIQNGVNKCIKKIENFLKGD